MTNNMTNLATTIPADQIRNAGEPVFPALRAWLCRRDIGADALIPLIDAREAYGIAKYGQTLMTGDDRDTATEAANETADQLVYGQKAKMQYPGLRGLINDAMLMSVQAALAWMDAIELMQQEPWTQAELDHAEVKAKELAELFGVSDPMRVKFWPGEACPQCKNETSFITVAGYGGKCFACNYQEGQR